jgi:hypothetical protein
VKISDVTLTLFAWGGIPPTFYGRHTGWFSGQSQLGLLTIRTDDVHAMNGPGLGARIDFDLIERQKTTVLS